MFPNRKKTPRRRFQVAFFLCTWILISCLVVSEAMADEPPLDLELEESVPEEKLAHWTFAPNKPPTWQTLDSGLEIAFFPGRNTAGRNLEIVILRIDPTAVLFSLHAASKEGEALSLPNWADRYHLVAAINASMYLPDGLTSTGYLRIGEHFNNSHLASVFGAFFVCEPLQNESALADKVSEKAHQKNLETTFMSNQKNPTTTTTTTIATNTTKDQQIPEAALLDRTKDDWKNLLPKYKNVVQNYRLISADRRLLWRRGGVSHAISAVGRDGKGHLLFIHCREPISGVTFGKLLLDLPLDIRLVMYTEGGTQAGLLVRSKSLNQIWMGRHPADLWTAGNPQAPLPNVIGVRLKNPLEKVPNDQKTK